MAELWLVDLGFACFGIEVAEGYVVEVPPIARWAFGTPWVTTLDYWISRGGSASRVS